MSTTTKNGKNVGYRLLAALFALACVGAFFIPVKVLGYFNGSFTLSKSTFLYKIVLDLVQSDLKLFGFLPAFASNATLLSVSTTIVLYFFVLTLLIGFITSFIAIFARKKAPAIVRFAAFMITLGAAAQTVTLPLITTYESYLTSTVDLYSLIFTCAFIFFYFVLMLAKLKGGAWIRATQFIITLAVTTSLFLAFIVEGSALSAVMAEKKLYKIFVLAAIGFLCVNLVISAITAIKEKGAVLDLVRIVLVALVALGIVFIEFISDMESEPCFFFSLAAAVVAILQVFVSVGVISVRGKKKARKALTAFANTFGKEEYVEVIPYEGGPVAGVRVAEEIVPVAKPGQPLRASGATYDLAAHAEGYDPFIALLNDQDRTDFTDLYILRCKGAMPEIPEYVVGGDNKEFFNKVFICLGQYREKIPNGLLAKMYDHSLKI